jgi:hypothetical protein
MGPVDRELDGAFERLLHRHSREQRQRVAGPRAFTESSRWPARWPILAICLFVPVQTSTDGHKERTET